MGTLVELFAILDGDKLDSGRIDLAPDPAIDLAQRALRGQADPNGALAALEQQIPRMRSVLRGLQFDVVEAEDRPKAIRKVRRIGRDLHHLTALLHMHSGNLDAAREQLVLAIACLPRDDDIRFRFVELYMETGAHADALATLVKTFGDEPEHRLSEIYQTFRLGRDIEGAGDLVVAREAYERVIARDSEAGMVRDLARRRRERIDGGTSANPDESELQDLFARAKVLVERGDLTGAAPLFLEILCHLPDHGVSWFFVGMARVSAVQEERGLETERLVDVTPRTLGEREYEDLVAAEQAFRLAVYHEPKFVEAYRQLSFCLLLLDRAGEALSVAEQAVRLAPEDASLLANVAVTRRMNGDDAAAIDAAQEALQRDPENVVAWSVLQGYTR